MAIEITKKCFPFQLRGRYIALSEAVKEVMFMVQLLGIMKIAVKYPVTVRVDRIDAIFMAINITTTCHTKHVDIKYKYVNEYVKDRVVKKVFVLY